MARTAQGRITVPQKSAKPASGPGAAMLADCGLFDIDVENKKAAHDGSGWIGDGEVERNNFVLLNGNFRFVGNVATSGENYNEWNYPLNPHQCGMRSPQVGK